MKRIQILALYVLLAFTLFGYSSPAECKSIKALIIDGQNNHKWEVTTPVLKKQMEETGLFTVDVCTSPDKKEPMGDFKPEFSKYDVLVMNYNGKDWPEETQKALESYMKAGGGMVIFHAADNSFPGWKE